jgi:hypothetical protein
MNAPLAGIPLWGGGVIRDEDGAAFLDFIIAARLALRFVSPANPRQIIRCELRRTEPGCCVGILFPSEHPPR